MKPSRRRGGGSGSSALASLLLCFALLALTHLTGSVDARFIVEKAGLRVRFPPEARKLGPISMALGNFGRAFYAGSLTGKLVYVDPDHGHPNRCQPACNYACSPYSDASPPFHLSPTSASAGGSSSGGGDDPAFGGPTNFVMLVDRGPVGDDFASPCKFAEKVWNAQAAGASAVLVVNYEDRHTTMEAPDDQDEVSYKYLRNITIPAAFLTKTDGQALKDLLRKGKDAYVSLDWTDVLPKREVVEWEFWSNSNDQCGAVCDVQKEFIKEFVPAARQLEGNWTKFTPHYIVWVCPSAYRGSAECRAQCTHGGRYCTPDPDGDLRAGYSGADIVAENLRQLCVFKLAAAAAKPWVWWDYVTRFGEQCTMASKQYGAACGERVFADVGGREWSSLEELRSCVGDVHKDEANPMLESEMARQRGGGGAGEVFILPTIRINGRQYRGRLAFDDVLTGICAGFPTDGRRPSICSSAGGSSSGDACRAGSAAALACGANKDGKTGCRNRAGGGGYECVCGPGFLSHKGPDGAEACLNINECVSASLGDLDPKCTCERCACKDTYGGYECISDIKDECAADHGGCWRKEYTIRGQKKLVSACHDRLAEFKDAAAHGRLTPDFKLSECRCPPCFSEFKQNGRTECVPKCDLDSCEEKTGVCTAGGGGGGRGRGSAATIWASAGVAFVALAAVAAGGYVAYRARIRAAMAAEVRSILSQYMELPSDAGSGGGAGAGANGNGNGFGRGTIDDTGF